MEEVEAGLTLFLDMPNLLYLTAKEKNNISLRGKACRALTYFNSRLQNWLTPWGSLYIPLYICNPHADPHRSAHCSQFPTPAPPQWV